MTSATPLQQPGVALSLTTIDIDDDALEAAMKLSGARTKKDAVDTALRDYTERHRRVASLERYADLTLSTTLTDARERNVNHVPEL